MLTQKELLEYKRNGFIGTFNFLSKDKVDQLTNLYETNKDRFRSGKEFKEFSNEELFKEKPWFKSLHSLIPEFYDVVSDPKIVEKVKSILGKDIILWSASVTKRPPGKSHRWHIDVEHTKWKGVSVFIGLKGTSNKATIKLISESHQLNRNDYNFKNNINDSEALHHCKKERPNASLNLVNIKEGEFFIFDGLIWHGSDNTGNETRYAIIAQYTTPNFEIEVPVTWDNPITWLKCNPPCVLVSGTDNFNINNLIERPN